MIANQENNTQAATVRKASAQGKQSNAELAQRVTTLAQAGSGDANENIPLTRKQLAVLHVLLDPDNAEKSDVEMMDLARVSKATFYKAKQNPSVHAAHQRMCKELILTRVAPIIQSSIKTALTAGRDGFQDRRLLLSMSGHYVERQQHEHNVTARVMVGVIGVSMDELAGEYRKEP